MTNLANRPHTALVVIDMQNGVVEGAHERDQVVANIATLVDRARAAQVPVVWVQHSAEDLPVGSEEWRYVPELPQAEGEPVVHKLYGDSFEETDLEDILASTQVGHLVVISVDSSGVWLPGGGVAEVEAAGGVEGVFGGA